MHALVKKRGGEILIFKSEKRKQPQFATKNDFLFFVETILPERVSVVALNFAYPLIPVATNGKLEGVLVSGTKENAFAGLIGKNVCQEIETHILCKTGRRIRVTAANDTICLLLSGMVSYRPNELAGGVVGTGLNFAFFEDEHTVVNLESANFNAFAQSSEGKIIDTKSSQKGKALFEKEVAGAYLFTHFNLLVAKQNLHYPPIRSTEELDILSRKRKPGLSQLAKSILRYSAQLAACQIAGIAKFKKSNMVFVMEGSLFWKGHKYREIVEQTVQQLTRRNVHFTTVQHSGIVGAAKLAG